MYNHNTMAKSEIGEVINVLREAPTSYQVRLPYGGIVIVEHTQIEPQRMTLLTRGTRLRVTHELGKVLSASTDLAVMVRGKVRQVLKQAAKTLYQVETDQGKVVVLEQSQVAHHPQRDLLNGAELDLHLSEDGLVIQAMLVLENDRARLVRIESERLQVSVLGSHGDRFTVRLPASVIRSLEVGMDLAMEIHYSADGERKIVLDWLVMTPPPATPPAQTAITPTRRAAAPARRPPTPPSPHLAEAAELVGIDPVYLQRVKQEGHRFEIISFLEQHARDGLIEFYRLRQGRKALFGQPVLPINAPIQQAIQASLQGFQGFFQHQARALDAIRQGRNLVVVTQTASGKTLCYNPAIFEYLAGNPVGHALYLFPLNALMMDQKEKIDDLVEALQAKGIQVTARTLVGGMGSQREEIARLSPHILATNPEMLSVVLKESRKKWGDFFAHLQFIVIDEVHTYRGMFGVHMAGLMRRLLLTARRFGADPRIILSSATVSNPLDLATRLTSLPESSFELIEENQDGSQQADKHWAVLNPDWGSPTTRFGNYQAVAADVFIELLTRRNAQGHPSPLNTILFCRSIREVKSLSRMVERSLQQRAPHLKGKIKTYISAELTIDAKREIYEGLRSGKYLGVISTNALEAGIDIGHLDACLITGFPFSVMAMRQMAGRVGRQEEGLVLFIPYPLNPLDQYYRDHPDLLLDQPPEVFVVDPHNPYLGRKHINAAAYDLAGLTEAELRQYWGERTGEITTQAQQDGVMRLVNGRWMGTLRNYSNSDDVYAIQSLRSTSQQPYAICLDDVRPCPAGSGCTPQAKQPCTRRIALLDRQYIYRDCHPGAIYEANDGRLFRVDSFDDANRVVKVQELPENTLERTYVEADLTVEVTGDARGSKSLQPGVDMAWGNVTITRLFTGYYTYILQPARRCRSCRREYDDNISACPTCHRPTEVFYTHTKAERKDFPAPHQTGFRIVLKSVASWLALQADLENLLGGASPCKLPGEKNRVLHWLKQPFIPAVLPARLKITPEEINQIEEYHRQASQAVQAVRLTPQEALLMPGSYAQCLMAHLRACLPESRALDLYQALTGYPVTEELQHVCRNCQTSMLFPAMHTLEHAVDARYPSVALGDQSDLGAYITLGHSATGKPTIFWFDNYEGGLGAAEKVFELFPRLLEAGLETLHGCTCTTMEGCPRCSYIPDCAEGNENLNKLAGIQLISFILGKPAAKPDLCPFIYRKKRTPDFEKAYKENEYSKTPRGVGEEAPQTSPSDPFNVLRVQPKLHAVVAKKAFEARSREIDHETPPLSASELNTAYQEVLKTNFLDEWRLGDKGSPFEQLEVLPNASLKMIQQIFRTIALQVHPDANPTRTAWANDMMKALNTAYDRVIKEKSQS